MEKILNLRRLFLKTKSTMSEQKPVHEVNVPYQTATFGMGCFWSADCLFGATPGVLRTKVGYSGGTKSLPKYRNIGDHVECVSVDYDPEKISYKKLLNMFWKNHEFGKRLKRQYTSLILYHNEKQMTEALASLEEIKCSEQRIYTEIAAAGTFYPAEDYHQKFRLQAHKDFVKTLELNSQLLLNSFVAAKLNGYLVGVGGIEQFNREATDLGLTQSQIDYVRHYVEEYEGSGLHC